MSSNLILRTLTSPYNGDSTRGSVLTHQDVDNNFINLKGGLIKTGTTSNNNLLLTSFDGNVLTIPFNTTGGTFGGGTTITGVTFDTHNTLHINDSTGGTFSTLINYLSGLTVTGNTMIGTNVTNGFTFNLRGDFNLDNGIGTFIKNFPTTNHIQLLASNSQVDIQSDTVIVGSTNLLLETTTGDIQFITGNPVPTQRARIFNSGNTIFGSATTDNGNKLQVAGTIQSDALISNRKRVVVADTNGVLQTTNETTNGIFYVARKYVGVGAASITGLTFSSITSSNATYLSQLNDARQGDENNPYPDPFSARNAALDAIASSAITHALIIVSGNDAWLIGSNDITKNGDLTGNASGNLTADIGFSTGGTIASLLQNNVTYFFNPVTLTYINAKFMISVGYVLDLTDAAFSSNIHGHLNVLQIYGEVNGFQANVLTINNANAKIIFEANQLNLQQYQAFGLVNVGNIIIDVERIIGPTMIIAGLGSNREGDGSDCIITMRIDSVTLGLTEIPYPTTVDFWYFSAQGDMSSMRNKLITISVESMVQSESSDSSLFRVGGGAFSINNVQYVLDMGNYHYKDWGHGRNGGGVIGSTGGSTPYTGNTSYNFNIDNCIMETAVLGAFWSPPNPGSIGTYNMNINVKNCVRMGTVNQTGIMNVSGLGFSDLARLKIEGNYYNLTSFPAITIHNNNGFPMPCRVMINNAQIRQLSGGTGMQILSVSGASTTIGLVDCIFTNDNSVPVLSSDTANSLIYVKNTHVTTAPTNIITTGDSLVVLSTINNFI